MTRTDVPELKERLDMLSERSTPGPYGVESYGSGTTYITLGTWPGHYASDTVPPMGYGRAEIITSNIPRAWGEDGRKSGTAHFLTELANAYRSGNLVTKCALDAQLAEAEARGRRKAREPLLQNVEPDDGFWVSCSGCHETNEGYETGHYAYSPVFKCYVGCGCRECGGLGVIWDNTDYSAMADFLAEEMDAPARETTVQEAAQALLASVPNPAFDILKPILMGEHSISFPTLDEEGEEYSRKVNVPWDVQKRIVADALRALAQGGQDDG